MSTLFDDLKTGLEQAIAYERGEGSAKVTTYCFEPVKRYTSEEIRRIRMQACMTQSVFAHYLGVSRKTVEAWECGRNHPTGPACRLIEILNANDEKLLPFVKVQSV